tara:strand:- start:954 stop:1175 length:222 start_codon:yes stop_codon:yes gene_type:complete
MIDHEIGTLLINVSDCKPAIVIDKRITNKRKYGTKEAKRYRYQVRHLDGQADWWDQIDLDARWQTSDDYLTSA